MIVAFLHVLHLQQIEQTIVKDDLVPTERGPRNNVPLMVCAIPIIVVALRSTYPSKLAAVLDGAAAELRNAKTQPQLQPLRHEN